MVFEKKRKLLFLDHDGTLTYEVQENGEMHYKYKNGLKEFLQFILSHFEVMWCSGLSHSSLLKFLKDEQIDKYTLDRIKYFDFDYSIGKANCILKKTNNFILIDDDISNREYPILNRLGLDNNLIKSNCKEAEDLYRIIEILKMNDIKTDGGVI